ncbi:HAD family hydrolase [Streptomyces sp. NPDC088182]|uniref:HAD family hydrolase n=1 Tax=Streptomyces sp. NPDC088182 TaxID=3365838 RepID=UPI0038003D16
MTDPLDPLDAKAPLDAMTPFDTKAPHDTMAPHDTKALVDSMAPLNTMAPLGSIAPPDAVRCVLFDFDGPVCALFRNHPAPGVAGRLLDWLPAGVRRLVRSEDGGPVTDPQVILRAVGELDPGGALVSELEARLTEEEVLATASAVPTPRAAELIRALGDAGVVLAVTTNNSPRAVRRYLERAGLADCFGPHLHGRTHDPHDPRRLKPHPDCLARALASTGAAAGESVMIGDAVADFLAAKQLGIRFLGYATRESKGEVLYEVGARVVVDELPGSAAELAALVGQLSRDGRPA